MQKRRYVATKRELARALAVTQRTLLRYWKLADHPLNRTEGDSRYDIEAWRQFIAERKSAHNFGTGHGVKSANGAYPLNEREQSIVDRNRILARREAFKLDVEMGEYIGRTSANQQVDLANGIVIREIDKAIESELPPRLEMVSAVEAKRILRKRFDAIYAQLPKHFAKVKGNAGNGA